MKKKTQERAGGILVNTVTRGGQVSIPFAVRKKLGIEEGTLLQFEIKGNGILVTPVLVTPMKPREKRSRR